MEGHRDGGRGTEEGEEEDFVEEDERVSTRLSLGAFWGWYSALFTVQNDFVFPSLSPQFHNIGGLNTEYRNQRRINVHAHLPIALDCRDFTKICGQLWSQEQPYMKFWASFPQIYGFQQAKLICKLTLWIGLAYWNRKI